MDFDRLLRELEAVGLRCKGRENGLPKFAENILTHSTAELAEAVLRAHVPDEEHYLTLDLVDCSELIKLVDKAQWAKYLAIQTEMIRRKRRAAYNEEADPIFMDCMGDQKGDLTKWHEKRKEIKARYPWPGEYR